MMKIYLNLNLARIISIVSLPSQYDILTHISVTSILTLEKGTISTQLVILLGSNLSLCILLSLYLVFCNSININICTDTLLDLMNKYNIYFLIYYLSGYNTVNPIYMYTYNHNAYFNQVHYSIGYSFRNYQS